MSDEPNKDPGASTDSGLKDGQVAVDGAELQRLQQADSRVKKIDVLAKEANLETAEDYVDMLEDVAADKLALEDPPPNDPPPVGDKDKNADPPPPTAVLSDVDRQELNEVKKAAAQSLLSNHFSEFRVEQGAKPEEERSLATKEELLSILHKKKAAVMEIAPDCGGNLFVAAEKLFNITPEGIKRAREAGEADQRAKDAAADTANLPGGGTIKPPEAGSPEAKTAEENQKARHAIAPPVKYEYPG